MVYLCIYVDDVLCIGHDNLIRKVIQDIKTRFSIKEIGKMSEYVGCTINQVENGVYLSQRDLIFKMQESFSTELSTVKGNFNTPASVNDTVVREKDEHDLINKEDQRLYRSGVGMLLYLIKHSRPDISNSVRELAKVLDGANPAQFKKLLRLIKYVNETSYMVLFLQPEMDQVFTITGYSDSDFAGDRNTRTSTSGHVLYVNGALVHWKSRGQKTVTLSSTEAEYVALSELCVEVVFLKNLLESISKKVNLPIKLHVDNVGAIFLSQNITTSQRTRHIDTRYHYVRNLQQDGIVEVIFVRTDKNDADLYTKNLGNELYTKHSCKYMKRIPT